MSIIKQTGDSAIVFSRRFTVVFLQIGMKFISDREDLFVVIFIFLSLVHFGPFGIRSILESKLNNRSCVTIFFSVTHPKPLV